MTQRDKAHQHSSPQTGEGADQASPEAARESAFEHMNQSSQGAGGSAAAESGQSSGRDAGSAPPETPEQTVERLQIEVEDANRRVLLAHAEMENLRKRMRRDYEDQLKFANIPLVRDILAVLDNLHRALAAAKATDSSSGLAEGVAIVAKQLEETLVKHHCHPIPAEGELFDPNYHEAISQTPSNDHPAGTVAHVAVVGYQLHDRVVRPSQVVVSTGPAGG